MMKYIVWSVLLLTPCLTYGQHVRSPLQEGQIYYELQEYDAAIERFRLVLSDPNSPREVYRYLVSSYLLNQQPEVAAKFAQKGLDIYPDYLQLQVMKGEALIQTDTHKAILVFENVLHSFQEAGTHVTEGIRQTDIKEYLIRLYQKGAAEASQGGRMEEALAYYRKALPLEPAEPSLHSGGVYTLLQMERWEEAEEAALTALNSFPADENLLFMYAQSLQHQSEYEQMTEVLERLYQLDADNMERVLLYGKALLHTNQADKASQFFWERIREFPEQKILYRTLIDINRQRFNQAGLLEVLRLKKKQFPDDANLLKEYGRELTASQKYEEAYAYFDSLATARQDAEFARLAVHALLFEEAYEQAESAYEHHLAAWPEDDALLLEYGVLLVNNGKFEKASTVLEQYLNTNHDDRMLLRFAELQDSCNDIKKAADTFRDPNYRWRLNWLLIKKSCGEEKGDDREFLSNTLVGMMRLYNSLQKEVQEEAQVGLNRLQNLQPPLFRAAGELHEARNELQQLLDFITNTFSFEVSMELLDTGLSRFPESVLVLYQKASLYYHHQMLNEARDYFEKLVVLNANREEFHFLLGQIYEQLDQYSRAIVAYERTIAINQKNRSAYQALIRIYQKERDLPSLCDRWLIRYRHEKENEVLKEFLIEALHKADRFKDAGDLLNQPG